MADIHFTENVVKHKWKVLLFTLLLFLACASGVTKLGFEVDGRVFFGPDNPMLKALDDFEATFNRENGIIVALEPNDGDVFTRETLSAIRELTNRFWLMPYASRSTSIANYQHTYVDGDDLIVEDLIPYEIQDIKNLTAEELEKIKSIALNELSLINSAVSEDGSTAIVFALTYVPEDNSNYAIDMTEFAYEVIKDFEKEYPNITFYVTGGAAMDVAFAEQSERDMSFLTPLMFLIMVVFIYIFLRSFSATISIVLVMIFSVFTAMGLAGHSGIALTGASGMAPVIILTLAVADAIHVLSNMFREMVFENRNKDEALIHSLKINFKPIFITSLTTAIGFLSMNFSDSPPFNDLGNIAATGVMAAFVYSVTFLPAFMSIMPASPSDSGLYSKHLTTHLADFVFTHEKKLFYGGIIIIPLMIFGVTKLVFDDNFTEYLDKKSPVRIATEYTEKEMVGLDLLEYAISAEEEGGINEPEYLENVEKFVNFWRDKEEVTKVSTITDVYKRLNKTMHGDDPAYYKIPESRELAAQFLLLYEFSLPMGLDLFNSINPRHDTTRITVYVDADTVRLRELGSDGDKWLKDNLPEEYFTPATGLSYLFAFISKRNIDTMMAGTIGALILISIILIIALKNLKIGLLSLIPNLVPAFCAFGLWGYFIGEVGLAVAVVAAISIGIVVDDTVHLLSKYMYYHDNYGHIDGKDHRREAIRFAFDKVGNAIIITSVVIAIGFSVMAFSGFKVNSSMGILTAMSVVLALFADLLFLPTLLMKLGRLNGKSNH